MTPSRPGAGEGAILTLEPLLDAVRASVEAWGWALSGLQKTTSLEFVGRWEGDSTRSAYAFFHRDGGAGLEDPSGPDDAALNVFLDETSRGLTGTLALVLTGPTLADLGGVEEALSRLAAVAGESAHADVATPVSVRARLPDAGDPPGSAEIEVRFKAFIGGAAIEAGSRVVEAVVRTALETFDGIARHPALAALLAPD